MPRSGWMCRGSATGSTFLPVVILGLISLAITGLRPASLRARPAPPDVHVPVERTAAELA